MRTPSLPNLTRFLLLTALGLSGALTGCYTQLYTRGYADRALESDRRTAYRPRPAADTLTPSSTTLQAGQDPYGRGPDGLSPDGQSPGAGSSLAASADSALGEGDGERSSAVIVNNYYPDRTYYRGYSTLDWDYPYISFGFYSSRYRDYWDPYWWHGSDCDRGYGGGCGPGYNRGYNHGAVPGGHSAGGNGSGNGAYHSDQRLFMPAPAYPELRKGRRTIEPQARPAPTQPAPEQPAPKQPAPKSDSNAGPSNQSEDKHESHPPLQKGRR